jgi:hypothetical protein
MRRQATGIEFFHCLPPSAYGLLFYKYGISLRMFFVSAADTIVDWRRRRLRFFPLLDSKWLLNPRARLTLPLPVTLNLFIAARLLLILGTSFSSV